MVESYSSTGISLLDSNSKRFASILKFRLKNSTLFYSVAHNTTFAPISNNIPSLESVTKGICYHQRVDESDLSLRFA
ncbi:MAG: hypothetical protein JJW01_03410 [Alphaproteobacteria bacterium]|nr:hypothetical protein [Rickettsiales bacterium]